MKKISEFYKNVKKNAMDKYLGEGNYKATNKRFQIINQVLNNDEIIVVTNNVQYWNNKDQYVLWVGEGRIVYLKPFQVVPVKNYEVLGDCYLVKLNRNYFKAYNCFVNEELSFDKEDTFDSLLEVAKQQTNNGLWFK